MRAIIAAALAVMLAGAAGQAKAETLPGNVHDLRAARLALKYPKVSGRVDKALAGDPKASKSVGIMFEVLEKDHAEAASWYRFAAIKGNARAQLLLANSYQHGRGVPKSNTLAFAWYLTASAHCEPERLSPEAFNGPVPDDEELTAAAHVSFLIQMAEAHMGAESDCSEYFDAPTGRRRE